MQVPEIQTPAENNTFYAVADITSISSPYYLWCQSEGYEPEDLDISEIWVDGEKQSGIPTTYTFSSTGKHIIKYVPTDGKYIKYNLLDFSDSDYNYLPINTIVIGEGIEYIDDYAFSTSKLTTVVCPSSLTTLQGFTFGNCSSLTSITFNGTKEQWNSISFFNGPNNPLIPISATSAWYNESPVTVIHCSDGDIFL